MSIKDKLILKEQIDKRNEGRIRKYIQSSN